MSELLTVRDLRVRFRGAAVEAVRGVSFTLDRGACLAIVGESGSGKSVTARTLLGLAGPTATVQAAELRFAGQDLTELTERRWRALRGRRIGLVAQDALGSLDPLRTVGAEIAEALSAHDVGPGTGRRDRVQALLAEVGVPQPRIRAAQRPHELSGGLRQRALIANAIAAEPELLLADEPTTALDVTVQAQLLELLAERKRRGTALLLISHDLAVVARLADRIAVMRDGQLVEHGETEQVLRAPRHAYTRSLLDAVPATHAKGVRLSGPGVAAAAPVQPGEVVLAAEGLGKRFRRPDGTWHDAVADVSFTLRRGETLGVVGESGSGKTTVARMVMGLIDPDRGRALLDGEPWSEAPERARRPRRRQIQMVYQDPLSSFDPRFTAGRVVGEAVRIAGVPRGTEHRRRVAELLDQVGLPATVADRRTVELSGGQRQRIAIARALATRPAVLVCDEPVSALDVSVQAQILDLLGDLQRELGLATLFISHDLGVIYHVSNRVLVVLDGRVVESGDVRRVFERPEHPYTRQLLAALPVIEPAPAQRGPTEGVPI
jgi:peptide/nickel transport system ATP-binding protein